MKTIRHQWGDYDPQSLNRTARWLFDHMPPCQAKAWAYLQTIPVPNRFRAEHVKGFFILDFYCQHAKLDVEIDGRRHEEERSRIHDSKRDRMLKEDFGITTMRFSSASIHNDFKGFQRTVNRFLSQFPPPKPIEGPGKILLSPSTRNALGL